MVNLNAKSPNKRRKSIAANEPVSDTPKKAKINEPKTPNKNNATPGKPNNKTPKTPKQTPAKNVAAAAPVANGTPAAPKTPGKQAKTPQQNNKQTPAKLNGKSPAQNNKNAAKSPVKQEKTLEQSKKVKREADTASDAESPAKKVKMFAGTAELEASPASPKKQNTKGKKQKQKKENKPKQGGPVDAKKKKKGLVFSVISAVAEGKGETVIESIDKKIAEINSRKELTKTARRRLRLLQKWKQTAQGNPPQPQSAKPAQGAALKKNAKAAVKPEAKAPKNQQKGKQQPAKKQEKAKQQQVKKETAPKIVKQAEESDDEEDSDEEESDYEVEAEVKPEKVTKTKGFTGDSDESYDEDDDESGDDEEEDEEEEPAAPAPKKGKKPEHKSQKPKQPNVQELKPNNILKKDQSRYVLFVGNLPFEATKEEISEHFSKTGKVCQVRIPTDITTQKPRGFAYVELDNEESYQKGLSLHHTFLKGRRINVLYTEGGKKKGEDRKQQVKAKNFKLHAMRKEGQLAGSVKDSQKRSFRRNKGKQVNGGA